MIPTAPVADGVLDCVVGRYGNATVVRLGGEIDSAGAQLLRELLRGLRTAAGDLVVLDMFNVESVDAAGYEALLAAWRLVDAGGGRLVLTGLKAPFLRELDAPAFAPLPPIYPSLEAGLTDLRAA